MQTSGELESYCHGTGTQRTSDTSLTAAIWHQSGTGINLREGFTFSSFQRLIENKEAKQQILSVVEISEPLD
jgi:hypothetical protein